MNISTLALVVALPFAAAACGKSKTDSAGAEPAATAPKGVSAEPAASTPTADGAHTPPAAPPIPASPCDAKAIEALEADLSLANGFKVDHDDKDIKAKIEAKKSAVMGTQIALSGCRFKMQGNDRVTFGADGTDKEIGCTMKGGEDGVRAFRDAAMTIKSDKLRLDVRATIGSSGEGSFSDVQPLDCTIIAHE